MIGAHQYLLLHGAHKWEAKPALALTLVDYLTVKVEQQGTAWFIMPPDGQFNPNGGNLLVTSDDGTAWVDGTFPYSPP